MPDNMIILIAISTPCLIFCAFITAWNSFYILNKLRKLNETLKKDNSDG